MDAHPIDGAPRMSQGYSGDNGAGAESHPTAELAEPGNSPAGIREGFVEQLILDTRHTPSLKTFSTVEPSELMIQGLLGKGGQAAVYKARWSRQFADSCSSIIVAVKCLKDMDPIYKDREALTLVTEHPNLMKCFDATLEAPYLIVTEFCAGGSLFNLIYNAGQELALTQKVKILTDVSDGVRYLHAHKPCIVHRDLKSSNVLLTRRITSTAQKPFAKVADFGLSRTTSAGSGSPHDGDAAYLTRGVGTWRWMAPEVFDLEGSASYDKRADIYSFAMLMYEVLAGKLPFAEQFPADRDDPRFAMHVCLGLRPSIIELLPVDLPPKLTDLMQRSWAGANPHLLTTDPHPPPIHPEG
jgi:serine/threonine protein kinase